MSSSMLGAVTGEVLLHSFDKHERTCLLLKITFQTEVCAVRVLLVFVSEIGVRNVCYCVGAVCIVEGLNVSHFVDGVHNVEGRNLTYCVDGAHIIEDMNVFYCVDVHIVEGMNVFYIVLGVHIVEGWN
jgi:hypothetical protein